MTVSGLDTPFDHLPRLPTLSDQAMNVSSTNDFAPDPGFRSLSYHRCHPCLSPHQAVNISNIDKPTNRYSHSTSLSTYSQTFVSANTPQSHNSQPCYFYNSRHHFNIADSLKMMNQKLLQPKD